jgi:hypothetical protein
MVRMCPHLAAKCFDLGTKGPRMLRTVVAMATTHSVRLFQVILFAALYTQVNS